MLSLTRWRRQKVAGNVAHDRLGNVTLHFEDDERVPSANAQREGNFEVNRTKLFNCVVSHVLESGERLRATKTGEANSGEDVCVRASLRLFQSTSSHAALCPTSFHATRTKPSMDGPPGTTDWKQLGFGYRTTKHAGQPTFLPLPV